MNLDPRAPVIVGVAQLSQRGGRIEEVREPLDLMTEVVAGAADDAGSRALLDRLDLVVAVRGAWSYSDPARLVADRVGSVHAGTGMTAEGGNAPLHALSEIARRIGAGQLDVGVVVGAEAIYSRRKARQAGRRIAHTLQNGTVPSEVFGDDYSMRSSYEHDRGLRAPVHYYALFENAIRAARGEALDEHRVRISGLLANFNEVAARNPLAWSRQRRSAAEIGTVTADNPMIAFPYTKFMCANWFTDQAAAVIVCSVEQAASLGVPRDRWIFVHSGTSADDTRHVVNRASLAQSPAIRLAGQRALTLASTAIADVAFVDVYSCFASAVQVAAAELGIDFARPLTVTGGLPYFGGPYSNYATHSLATMATTLRHEPRAYGLITANGGYLTKHAFCVLSGTPAVSGYRAENCQHRVNAVSARSGAPEGPASVVIEATTVVHDRGEPVRMLMSGLTERGERLFATSEDPDTIREAMVAELAGASATVTAGGAAHLDEPAS